MTKRPMKRAEKRFEEQIEAFWNKTLNPITMWKDGQREKKINSLRNPL